MPRRNTRQRMARRRTNRGPSYTVDRRYNTFTFAQSIPNGADAGFTMGSCGIPTDRPTKILRIRLTLSVDNAGQNMSGGINAKYDNEGAVSTGWKLLMATFPRVLDLHVPPSTDFQTFLPADYLFRLNTAAFASTPSIRVTGEVWFATSPAYP